MFVGHFAVAFAAKRAAPAVSLGTWFIACELVDLLWPVFLLLGIESVRIAPGNMAFTPLAFDHYPWTHSLLMCTAWAVAMGALLWRRSRVAATLVMLVVLSHWFLDAIVHRPDLPLAPGTGVKIGFGLWNSVAGTLVLELAMFVIGLGLYLRGSRPVDRIGRHGLWVLVVLLLAAYGGAAFGPPPPSIAAIAWAGILGGLITAALGYWIDAHRRMKA
jgi:membrane-bound metal-dependent hydrolase YbcI (DUF457 family)